MIQNVIFDLGRVLITWDPIGFMRQFTSDEERIERVAQNVPRSDLWVSLDQGLHTTTHARKIFLEKYPDDAELINYWFDHWFEIFAPIPETVELLQQVKEGGYRTYVLSNFIKDAYEYVHANFDFFALFDGGVISYQAQRVKPDLAIYEILLSKYNLVPEECVFIDDTPSFVAAAESLGIHAIQFTSVELVRKSLAELGVQISSVD